MNRKDQLGRWAWGAGLAVLAAGVILLGLPLRADDAGQTGRAARLSSVDGQVQIAQGNQVLADPAIENTPLFEGTQVATGDDGRAELQFEDGSLVRLSPNSSLTITVLRGQGTAGEAGIVLESGLGYFELQAGSKASKIWVQFGDTVVHSSGFTVLRINLDNPPGELAVFSGNAHLERGGALALDLHGGESVALNGADPSRYNLAESIEPDSWDTWNSDRDQVLSEEATAKTGAANSQPNSGNPAWNDLDANGNWYNVPGEGYIWSPYEAADAGWDPYGNGSWMWTPGFNYIWVSGDPWGYMPYQCGAWNYYNSFGWGWAPGMCNPWWGGGYFGPNIGYGPGGYRPPVRPRHRPVRPVGRAIAGQGGKLAPYPLVPVSHRPSGVTGGLPARDRNASVEIAGHVLQPLRPLASARPSYDRTGSGIVNRTAGAYPGARPATGPGFVAGRPSSSPAPRASGSGGSQHAASSGHSSGGSSGGSSSGHASSGGGGGGAHGGGGGGGGGGSHH